MRIEELADKVEAETMGTDRCCITGPTRKATVSHACDNLRADRNHMLCVQTWCECPCHNAERQIKFHIG